MIISTQVGAGKRMLNLLKLKANALGASGIITKCPQKLISNQWYERRGFQLGGTEKLNNGTMLNIWWLPLARGISKDDLIKETDKVTKEIIGSGPLVKNKRVILVKETDGTIEVTKFIIAVETRPLFAGGPKTEEICVNTELKDAICRFAEEAVNKTHQWLDE